jgi:hypothetical protein
MALKWSWVNCSMSSCCVTMKLPPRREVILFLRCLSLAVVWKILCLIELEDDFPGTEHLLINVTNPPCWPTLQFSNQIPEYSKCADNIEISLYMFRSVALEVETRLEVVTSVGVEKQGAVSVASDENAGWKQSGQSSSQCAVTRARYKLN